MLSRLKSKDQLIKENTDLKKKLYQVKQDNIEGVKAANKHLDSVINILEPLPTLVTILDNVKCILKTIAK